jgi:hypothetical protein
MTRKLQHERSGCDPVAAAPPSFRHPSFRGGGRRRRSGQVLVITLLAMVLLVGLVFFVYNVGDSANQRVELQNAADAVAVSGAGWMARSMNIIAMNNVAMSRMIAIVPVLDSQPLAVEMSLEEARAWQTCLARQLTLVNFSDGGPLRNAGPKIEIGIRVLDTRMIRQRDILDAIDSRINTARSGFRMAESTTWSVPGVGGAPPHGRLWQAAVTCDEFSQATLASAGVLAAADAHRFGKLNGVDAAFLVPILPLIPAKRGGFDLWQPVLQGYEHVESNLARYKSTGGNGGAIPDFAYPHRLGPWARLYKWRDPASRETAREWVPGTPGVGKVRGGTGNVDISGRHVGSSARTAASGHQGYWRTTDSEIIGYNTYGPFSWAMRRLDWYANDRYWEHSNTMHYGDLPDTYYYNYVNDLCRTKMGYMFGPKATRTIHYPQYHTFYPECVSLASDPMVRVSKTMFYMVDFASSVQPADASNWLSPGTYRSNGEPPPRGKGYPMSIWVNGWQDPARWKKAVMVGNYVWRDDYTIEVTEDRELGIRAQIDPITGEPVWQPVYMTAFYIFGGIDTGGEREINNPCNWDQYDIIPSPIVLDTTQGDYSPEDQDHDLSFRRKMFTYLGVVRKDHAAPVLSQRFSNINPVGGIITMGQAELFNKCSWDLWTQDWRVQLVPVTKWADWIARLEEGVADAGATNGMVTEAEIETVLRYMNNLGSDLAEAYINH